MTRARIEKDEIRGIKDKYMMTFPFRRSFIKI